MSCRTLSSTSCKCAARANFLDVALLILLNPAFVCLIFRQQCQVVSYSKEDLDIEHVVGGGTRKANLFGLDLATAKHIALLSLDRESQSVSFEFCASTCFDLR
jgi:hypothetical protein